MEYALVALLTLTMARVANTTGTLVRWTAHAESAGQARLPLHIVVIDGEGAVNVIERRTAVAPVVEVRDRNNVPVAGASVTFAVGHGSSATFAGGAETVRVTTDATGRAVSAALSPATSGRVQIHVQAAFQGQTATAPITQVNVLTAAAAGDDAGGSSGTTFTGPFASQLVVTTTVTANNSSSSCASTRSVSGTMTMKLIRHGDGSITGSVSTDGTEAEIASTVSPLCTPLSGSVPFNIGAPVTGTAGNLVFNLEASATSTGVAVLTSTNIYAFAGGLNNGVVTGALLYSELSSGQQQPPFNGVISGGGSTTIAVTLR